MAPLIITASILLFFIFLFSLRAVVTIGYADEVTLSVRVLFIKIKILPSKKKKVNINKYQIEKFRKSEKKKYEKALKKYNKKLEKAALKAERKEEKKNEKEEERKDKVPLVENIKFIQKLVGIFFYRFARHFRIYIARMKINIATGDAAQTAIMYGVVVQSVSYIIEILQRVTNLDKLDKSEIQVNTDYLSEKISADVLIKFSLRVWHLFDILFHIAFGFFKYKPSPQKSDKPVIQNKK